MLPRRWVVERTFSWFGRNRRLAKDYENSPIPSPPSSPSQRSNARSDASQGRSRACENPGRSGWLGGVARLAGEFVIRLVRPPRRDLSVCSSPRAGVFEFAIRMTAANGSFAVIVGESLTTCVDSNETVPTRASAGRSGPVAAIRRRPPPSALRGGFQPGHAHFLRGSVIDLADLA